MTPPEFSPGTGELEPPHMHAVACAGKCECRNGAGRGW